MAANGTNAKSQNLEPIIRIIEECQGIAVEVPLRNLHPGGLARPPLYGRENEDVQQWLKEFRFIKGERREVVLLDSVESQANRLESLLRKHVPQLPDIKVKFSNGDEVSVYEAPHRIFDAIFIWGSELNGTRFGEHDIIKKIEGGGEEAEKTLFKYAPLVLLFGGWYSHGKISAGKAPRWPRLITLEIVGTEPEVAHRTSSRIDPIGTIPKELLPEYMKELIKQKEKEEKEKGGKPSKLGLGMIPPQISPLDVVVKEAYLLGAISLVGIRNLRLPDEAKAVLLILALLGLALQHEVGYRLRSGADFVARTPLVPELLGCKKCPPQLSLGVLDTRECQEMLKSAVEAVSRENKELEWPQEDLILEPHKDFDKAYRDYLDSLRGKEQGRAEDQHDEGKEDQAPASSEEG